ncbi:MAG: hypothetical protein LPD71_05875, partial [Shewanella sp.]|nr:hypothetical protein [Shewanella sp.]
SLPRCKRSEAYKWFSERWARMAVKAGLSMPNQYGLDIRDGSAAGEYISKYGSDSEILTTKLGQSLTWDFADEAVKGGIKQGKQGSLTPFGILQKAIYDSDNPSWPRLFLEFARATKGKALLRWSKGLRSALGICDEELSDQEVVDKAEEDSDLIAILTSPEWKAVLKAGVRAELLNHADEVSGSKSALAKFVYDLVKPSVSFTEFKTEFVARSNASELSAISAPADNHQQHNHFVDCSIDWGVGCPVPISAESELVVSDVVRFMTNPLISTKEAIQLSLLSS